MELAQKKHRLVELLKGGASLTAAYQLVPWSRTAVRHARKQDRAFDARLRRALEAREEDDEWG